MTIGRCCLVVGSASLSAEINLRAILSSPFILGFFPNQHYHH